MHWRPHDIQNGRRADLEEAVMAAVQRVNGR
jgi:hypothetical protein